jgi:hypothetical protein
VVIQNPSSVDSTEVKFAVPHGHYTVKQYDEEAKQFEIRTA